MSSSSSNRFRRDPPPTHCECEEPVILQTSKTINFPLRRFLGCVNYYHGSACETFYWVDPDLPNEYYKKEVFKLMKKVKLNENKIDEELKRSFDFERSTMHKQAVVLQMELKEMKASIGFYRKLVVFLCMVVFILLLVK
ncbi:hypothetical protein CTI12_AA510660 [Artemisia annua]|uniref:Zinc finger GRF-type domain-containing protein n=1 Tax=Artemisia annua TaxID=35608 RepID=A0A2U1LAY0_ARTAN|nr:hypothetical protein CTI12_AA510660 [Artemisia annua]